MAVIVKPKPLAGPDQMFCMPHTTATVNASPAGGVWSVATGNPANATINPANGSVSGLSVTGK